MKVRCFTQCLETVKLLNSVSSAPLIPFCAATPSLPKSKAPPGGRGLVCKLTVRRGSLRFRHRDGADVSHFLDGPGLGRIELHGRAVVRRGGLPHADRLALVIEVGNHAGMAAFGIQHVAVG